jgi:sulfur-oxidizing protein SoxY
MNTTRRMLLKAAGSAGLIASGVAAGLLNPVRALADWDSAAFSATRLTDALAAIGASGAATSLDVVVKTPDIAENGAVVPVEIVTTLTNVESIHRNTGSGLAFCHCQSLFISCNDPAHP